MGIRHKLGRRNGKELELTAWEGGGGGIVIVHSLDSIPFVLAVLPNSYCLGSEMFVHRVESLGLNNIQHADAISDF